MIIVGSLVAIGVAKLTFGGLGSNIFNPALVGRAVMLISFPTHMTLWPLPKGFATGYYDAVTGATPLAIVKDGISNGVPISELMNRIPTVFDLIFGNMAGSIGEVSAIAILIGFIYLLYKRIITWHIPVAVIGSLAVFTSILWVINPEVYVDPMFHLLAGGVLLGAIFMATDYVTSPMIPKSMIIYGCGIGILTAIIRIWGAYPEGIMFAILIMNAFVPLLNAYIKPKRFGGEVKNG
jgi:electron transport complex protein RnfD